MCTLRQVHERDYIRREKHILLAPDAGVLRPRVWCFSNYKASLDLEHTLWKKLCYVALQLEKLAMTNFHLKIPLSTASFAALFCIYLPFHSLCPFILYLAKSDLHNKRRVERRVERRDEKKSVYKGCSGRLHTRSMRYATQRKSRATWPIQDTSQARLRYEGKHKERERKQENGTKKDKRRPGQLRSWRPDLHIINL